MQLKDQITEKFQGKYRVSSIRLSYWDYRSEGMYFITICTKNKNHFFGKIDNDSMILSPIGKMVQKYWYEIPHHFPNVSLDEFVVMPDHIHGIIVIHNMYPRVETCYGMSLQIQNDISKFQYNQFSCPIKQSLSMIINHYKGTVKRQCNKNNINFEWQSRFYERIIRNEKELHKTRLYIQNNPSNWNKKQF